MKDVDWEVLTKRGISENRLILEERSTPTEENLKYTGEILKDRGLDMTVTLVTSEFHEYRANQIATYGLYKADNLINDLFRVRDDLPREYIDIMKKEIKIV